MLMERDMKGVQQLHSYTFKQVYEMWLLQHKQEIKPTTLKAKKVSLMRRFYRNSDTLRFETLLAYIVRRFLMVGLMKLPLSMIIKFKPI